MAVRPPFTQRVSVRDRPRSDAEVAAGVRAWRGYVALWFRVSHPADAGRFAACEFRVDTGTDFSFLPAAVASAVGLLDLPSVPLEFGSSSGRGVGRLFRDVSIIPASAPDLHLLVDLVVADGYKRDYGLLSFRDLHVNFRVETSADVRLDDPNPPINAGHWVFHPRG